MSRQDGVVNAFDMAALLWVQFGQAPYNALSRDFSEISTVNGRDDTAWRCGRNEDKATWQRQLGNNYCASPLDTDSVPITYTQPTFSPLPPPSPTLSTCLNTCTHADDEECDDGGPGNDYDLCAFGSDCERLRPQPPQQLPC